MLPKEQVKSIKEQLIKQIESTFPDDKKEEAKKEIESMSDEQLETFLKQNGLMKQENQKCIFCSIILNEIPSYKITEDEKSVAVFEINPVSKGHAIVIPKTHSSETPKESQELAQELAKKISEILKPKKTDIVESEMFGHKIINIIPVYNDENIHSQRQKADESDLKLLQDQFSKTKVSERTEPVEELKKLKEQKPITEKDMILPRRIP